MFLCCFQLVCIRFSQLDFLFSLFLNRPPRLRLVLLLESPPDRSCGPLNPIPSRICCSRLHVYCLVRDGGEHGGVRAHGSWMRSRYAAPHHLYILSNVFLTCRSLALQDPLLPTVCGSWEGALHVCGLGESASRTIR